MHTWALETIEHVYNEQMKEAEESAAKIISAYPDHPAGYFFMAVVIDSWMLTHQSDKREDEFFRFCELAIEKGEKKIDKNPDDEWSRFFIGGAEGYKGTYEARFERWISAFRCGWKGVSVFQKLEERKSGIPDLDYGIGSYEYWRSAMMKRLWWMPMISDKRKQGIEKLLKAEKDGIYTKVSAAQGLMDVFLNEKRFADALPIADEACQHYPASRLFCLGKAHALCGLNRFEEAEAVYRQVLARAEADPAGEHATIALCHFWIAGIYLAQRRFSECIAECDLMKKYEFNDDSRELLENRFSDIEGIKKKAEAGQKKLLENGLATKKE